MLASYPNILIVHGACSDMTAEIFNLCCYQQVREEDDVQITMKLQRHLKRRRNKNIQADVFLVIIIYCFPISI